MTQIHKILCSDMGKTYPHHEREKVVIWTLHPLQRYRGKVSPSQKPKESCNLSQVGCRVTVISYILRIAHGQAQYKTGAFSFLSKLYTSLKPRDNKTANLPVSSQSTTNKMQHFSNLFISVRRSTCFKRGFPVHHQKHKTAHTASGICQTVTATCC